MVLAESKVLCGHTHTPLRPNYVFDTVEGSGSKT